MKRILLIGLGRWGLNHLRVLKSMPVELFVSDLDEQRLNSSDVAKSRRSKDALSLFPQIDAAIVVTPGHTHFEISRRLLEMGKDVFVEKPISLKSSEAKQLAESAETSGRILQVGHIFRFDPASQWIRTAIERRRFGRIKILRAKFSGLKRPRPDTGVTLADSIHFMDLFNFFIGRTASRVHAVMNDFLGRGMDDESLVVLEYDRGDPALAAPIHATVEAGYHAPGKVRELTIVGDEASAVCDYNVAQYKIKLFENRHVADGSSVKAVEGAVRQLEFPPEEPLRAELAAFLEAIEKRSQPLVDGWAGFQAVRVAEAALESAKTHRWIEINTAKE